VTDFFASWAPQQVVSTIASFSFLTHFNAITRGVIDLRDVIYFSSLIAVWLIACGLVVDMKKAGCSDAEPTDQPFGLSRHHAGAACRALPRGEHVFEHHVPFRAYRSHREQSLHPVGGHGGCGVA